MPDANSKNLRRNAQGHDPIVKYADSVSDKETARVAGVHNHNLPIREISDNQSVWPDLPNGRNHNHTLTPPPSQNVGQEQYMLAHHERLLSLGACSLSAYTHSYNAFTSETHERFPYIIFLRIFTRLFSKSIFDQLPPHRDILGQARNSR